MRRTDLGLLLIPLAAMVSVLGVLPVAGCSGGSGGKGGFGSDGGSGGVSLPNEGDRLFEGTVSTDGGSGTITLVVHQDQTAEAVIATGAEKTHYTGTVSATGSFSLHPSSINTGSTGTQATGTGSTASASTGSTAVPVPLHCQLGGDVTGWQCSVSGQIMCGTLGCCEPGYPYVCPGTSNCYATLEQANKACGNSCISCGDAPTTASSNTGSTGTATDSSGGIASSTTGGGASGFLEGTLTGDLLSGSFTDASGNSGIFSAQDATHAPVTEFCGTFAGDDDGVWNLQVGSGHASGSFEGTFSGGTLDGQISDGAVTLTFAEGTASGRVSGSMVTGTWQTPDGASGTWQGSEGACGGASGISGGMAGATSSGSPSSSSGGCCQPVTRNGKTLTSCCIEGCGPNGTCL